MIPQILHDQLKSTNAFPLVCQPWAIASWLPEPCCGKDSETASELSRKEFGDGLLMSAVRMGWEAVVQY